MKLKKHMILFVRVITKIISRSNTKNFTRSDLCMQINNTVKDRRISINNQQLAQIIKQQKDFDFENTRKQYSFKEKP